MEFEINDGSIPVTALRDSSSEGAFLDLVRCCEVRLPAGDVTEPFVNADGIADVAYASDTAAEGAWGLPAARGAGAAA